MKIESVKALTMVELLVALVISSVLILMVGVISQVAFSSHEEIRNESDVHSDIFSGLSWMNFSVRKAFLLEKVPAGDWSSPGITWKEDILVIDDNSGLGSAFGFYQPKGKKIKFGFVPDKNKHGKEEDIEEILIDIDTISSFDFTISPNNKLVTFSEIKGTKNNEEFKISNFVIMRRNG